MVKKKKIVGFFPLNPHKLTKITASCEEKKKLLIWQDVASIVNKI